MVEAAERGQAGVERALPGMAERRMAEIVRQRQRLGEIFVESKPAGERAGHLRHFKGVGEPRAVMVALVEDEHLGLVLEAAEGGRVDDPVAIAAEGAAAFAGGLGMEPAAALGRVARVGRPGYRSFHRQLTLVAVALNYRAGSVAIGAFQFRSQNA